MLKNYLKISFRSFRKNRFYSSLNIAGLAIALATCLMIVLYVYDELSYDKFNTKSDRIYRVNNDIKIGNIQLDVAQTPPLLGPEAVKLLPGVEQYTRLRRRGNLLIKKGNTNLREGRVVYADSTLFGVFSLQMISGDPATALNEPYTLVITETIAKKYFNRVDVAGQQLIVDDTLNYRIGGVIKDIPKNSHFNFDFFVAFAENKRSREPEWMSQNFNTYLLLKNGAEIKKTEEQLNSMLTSFMIPTLKTGMGIGLEEFHKQGNYVKCTLTPLTSIHLHSNRPGEIGENGSVQYVRIFSLIATFILIIAYVNFVNMFTARSSNRAKEVGVRKVLGSQRKSLVAQFLVESLFTIYISLGIAILIAVLLLPYFNGLSGKNISLRLLFRPSLIAAFFIATTITGLLAGCYPALLLSAFKPIEVLKGKIARGFRGSWLRNSLVVLQFSVSIILIIGTIVIYNQLRYIRNKDIGFNRQQVIVIRNTDILKTQATAFKNELSQVSGVEKVTMTGYVPVNGYLNSKTFHPSPVYNPKSVIVMQAWFVDEDYIPALDIRLLAGRNFSRDFLSDSMGIIINEAAAKLLDTDEPPGKKLYASKGKAEGVAYTVIGVIKNFHFSSLRDEVTPLCLMTGKENSSIAVRLSAQDITPVIARIKNKWLQAAGGQPFNYSFMDEDFNRLYFTEQRTGQIFISFSVLAILIACIGLFALVAYAAEQRIREIGIRKVLGASVVNIAGLLSIDFLKLVLIAALISFPLAWWFANKWLEDFASRINIGWEVFAIAGTTALFIALLTISYQAVKAAVGNPVKNLRAE